MRSILWLDDDLDDYPAVRRIARQLDAQVKPFYNISSAVEWLDYNLDDPPEGFLLDAIVSPGGFPVPQTRGSETRYTCLLVLDRYPQIVGRTVVLSIVPPGQLRRASFPPTVPIFRKSDLAQHLGDFREALRKLLDGAGGTDGKERNKE